jgi:propionyl-CoA carboxylase beta chain
LRVDWGWDVWSALMVAPVHGAGVLSGSLPPERRVNRVDREEQAMAEDWVEELLDPGSFVATAVGGRSGHGSVDGRPVCVVDGLGPAAVAALDLALKVGCPVVAAVGGTTGDAAGEAPGAPTDRGAGSADPLRPGSGAYGELLSRGALASGVVPQVALVLGAAVGGPALVPALADFVVMVEGDGRLQLGDTEAIATVSGELVDVEELAGTRAHTVRTGTAHFRAADLGQAVDLARALLGYLPGNNLEEPPALEVGGDPSVVTARDLELDGLLSGSAELPFDARRLVERVVDDGELLEVQALFAGNLICGLGRVDGRPVGVVASQPLVLAGALDAAAAEKAARFVRTCDAFNLPVLTFVDGPGVAPDADQERQSLVRRAAKLAYAYAEATVPKVTVVARQAVGPAAEVLGGRSLRADLVLAWPDAQVAGLAPEQAATHGLVHDVIPPSQTRPRVVAALRLLRGKRESHPPKRHGNIPL